MSGYRRFVAYVYEYQKGKKGSNCGFIKVEVRDQRCSMEVHLHCTGLTPQVECKVYGFIRKDGLMNGILLGSCETGEDTAECLIETDSLNMGGSGISLGKMGGMVLVTESGGFFGTEWDDQPIRPDNFQEIRETGGQKKQTQRENSGIDNANDLQREGSIQKEIKIQPVENEISDEKPTDQNEDMNEPMLEEPERAEQREAQGLDEDMTEVEEIHSVDKEAFLNTEVKKAESESEEVEKLQGTEIEEEIDEELQEEKIEDQNEEITGKNGQEEIERDSGSEKEKAADMISQSMTELEEAPPVQLKETQSLMEEAAELFSAVPLTPDAEQAIHLVRPPVPPNPGPGPRPPMPPKPGPGPRPPMPPNPGPGPRPPMPPKPGPGPRPPMPPNPGPGPRPPMPPKPGPGPRPPMPPNPGPGPRPPMPPKPGPGPRPTMSSPAMTKASFGEEFVPFDDGEIVQCWKIHPNDFVRFQRRECSLRNNRFLLYGYYNFGHLLLGRKANGQYILGVPGCYDQQERFMANMFGFPYFKESPMIELPNGRGGYWYRLINAPNFH